MGKKKKSVTRRWYWQLRKIAEVGDIVYKCGWSSKTCYLRPVALPVCLPHPNNRRTDIRLTCLCMSFPCAYEIVRVDDIQVWNCIVKPHVEKEWKSREITALFLMLWVTVIFENQNIVRYRKAFVKNFESYLKLNDDNFTSQTAV